MSHVHLLSVLTLPVVFGPSTPGAKNSIRHFFQPVVVAGSLDDDTHTATLVKVAYIKRARGLTLPCRATGRRGHLGDQRLGPQQRLGLLTIILICNARKSSLFKER